MGKSVIKLNESNLKDIIRNTIIGMLNEGADEVLDTPSRALGAVFAADADKKKHPGRSKDSADPAIRKKRDRQMDAFGHRAADLMNNELGNDPRFTVKGDRGARTMQYQNGPMSAYLRTDSDPETTTLYDDEYVDGDAKKTLADLEPAEHDDLMGAFDKFKAMHRDARDAYDSRLEEGTRKTIKMNESQLKSFISETVSRVLNETTLDYDVDNFSGRWGRGPRYDILVDGEPYYSDVPDESVDRLCSELERMGYDDVKVVEL